MAGTYESFKEPFINLFTLPFLIVGAILIHLLLGSAFSMVSMIGVVMLIGIVVNNGIILVDYTNLLVDRGLSVKEACFEAGKSRLRPVLMTTLTTILGMIPMCFASSGSAAMVQPIGVAVVGGLSSSTFITLFFIPVLYSLVMKEKAKAASNIKVLLPPQQQPRAVSQKAQAQPQAVSQNVQVETTTETKRKYTRRKKVEPAREPATKQAVPATEEAVPPTEQAEPAITEEKPKKKYTRRKKDAETKEEEA